MSLSWHCPPAQYQNGAPFCVIFNCDFKCCGATNHTHTLVLFSCLQVKYKETVGQGTPVPDLPEVKRIKETQKHISSVVAAQWHACVPPATSQLLH